MERKVITYDGSELGEFILGQKNEDGSRTFKSFEFRWEPASSPVGAQIRARRMSGNPNYRPVPFQMPSALWDSSYYMYQYKDIILGKLYNATEEEKFQAINPPKYLINGWTRLGGSVDEFTANINNADVKSDVYINDTTFKDSLIINYLTSKYYLHFTNCVFQDVVHLMYVQIDEVSFDNCKFESTLFITNCDINKLRVGGKSVAKNINIKIDEKETYPVNVFPNDILHKIQNIELTDISVTEKLKIGAKNIGSIFFDKVVIKETVISLEQPTINISGDDKKHLIDELEYTCTAGELPSNYTISDLSIGDFKLKGVVNSDDSFTVISCDIKKLYIQDFTNGGKFVLNDVKVFDELHIKKSDLAETLFIGVKLRNVQKCEIVKANITDIILYNTSFSDNINEGNDLLHEIRDIYRQLKYASSKQNDRLNELRYEAIETSMIRKILEESDDKDKWIFRFNDWTSKHGQDWVHAFWFLVITTLVFFCCIQWLMGYRSFSEQLFLANAAQNTANFFYFLNPIHRFVDLFGVQENRLCAGTALLLDASYRILSGYLIFQFLRAFRKYFRS